MLSANKKFIDKLKRRKIFQQCFQKKNISNYKYTNAMDFFLHFWGLFETYKISYKKKTGKAVNNSVPGSAFEIIIGFILDHENIEIKSMDEEIIGVDFVKPDFAIKKRNTFISLKVSFRERWKQAAYESIWYKKTFPSAKCYLVTNDFKEYVSLKKDISKIELDELFYASSSDLNKLIKKLR